ncbi:hypothetical protein LRK71_01665 [Pseudophaeobacter sp. MA21411-1]|nr:hypothetical protein [Pseudophaeobacter flagellatus]
MQRDTVQEAEFAVLSHLKDGPANKNMAACGRQLVSPWSTLATFGQARLRLRCAITDEYTRKQSPKNRLCSSCGDLHCICQKRSCGSAVLGAMWTPNFRHGG